MQIYYNSRYPELWRHVSTCYRSCPSCPPPPHTYSQSSENGLLYPLLPPPALMITSQSHLLFIIRRQDPVWSRSICQKTHDVCLVCDGELSSI